MTNPAPTPAPAPHPIWEALLSPARSVEVRAWLRVPANVSTALAWRGPRGETMLHWGAMADLGLMVDLLAAGLDANAVDSNGLSPVNWLAERLWMTHMEGVGSLTALNLRKLRLMTDDLLSALWRQEGRPHAKTVDMRVLAMRTGLWQCLATWRDLEGEWAWSDWSTGTALHAWPLAPAEQGREDFLELWKDAHRSVDVEDVEGRTPLFVAVQTRLSEISPRSALDVDAAIDALLAAGADPEHVAHDGRTPLMLTLDAKAEPNLVEHLTARLEKYTRQSGGLEM